MRLTMTIINTARIADNDSIGRKTMQNVVRTAPTRKGYWYDEEKMKYLSELLKNGWKVVMCNRIGEDLEYIVEKEEP